eukprot:3589712-Rhodomonas_salina.3
MWLPRLVSAFSAVFSRDSCSSCLAVATTWPRQDLCQYRTPHSECLGPSPVSTGHRIASA